MASCPWTNQTLGQFGSNLAASFSSFSAKCGSPRMWWASPKDRRASVWCGLAATAFRKHCLASCHCSRYTQTCPLYSKIDILFYFLSLIFILSSWFCWYSPCTWFDVIKDIFVRLHGCSSWPPLVDRYPNKHRPTTTKSKWNEKRFNFYLKSSSIESFHYLSDGGWWFRTFIRIIHGFWGPGRAVNELKELAASLSACSTREAAAKETA